MKWTLPLAGLGLTTLFLLGAPSSSEAAAPTPSSGGIPLSPVSFNCGQFGVWSWNGFRYADTYCEPGALPGDEIPMMKQAIRNRLKPLVSCPPCDFGCDEAVTVNTAGLIYALGGYWDGGTYCVDFVVTAANGTWGCNFCLD